MKVNLIILLWAAGLSLLIVGIIYLLTNYFAQSKNRKKYTKYKSIINRKFGEINTLKGLNDLEKELRFWILSAMMSNLYFKQHEDLDDVAAATHEMSDIIPASMISEYARELELTQEQVKEKWQEVVDEVEYEFNNLT